MFWRRCGHPAFHVPHARAVDTLVELRGESGNVKVIAISGGGDSGPLRLPPDSSALDPLDIARELGANMCLRKPFQVSALLDVVNHVLAPGLEASRSTDRPEYVALPARRVSRSTRQEPRLPVSQFETPGLRELLEAVSPIT